MSATALDPRAAFRWAPARPWLRSIVAPTAVPKVGPEPPTATLRLEWVHGYSAQVGLRGNLGYNARGHLVYSAAGVGVVLRAEELAQEHYLGHQGAEIQGLAVDGSGRVVLSAALRSPLPGSLPDGPLRSVAKEATTAQIHLWDAETGQLRARLPRFHARGVTALAWGAVPLSVQPWVPPARPALPPLATEHPMPLTAPALALDSFARGAPTAPRGSPGGAAGGAGGAGSGGGLVLTGGATRGAAFLLGAGGEAGVGGGQGGGGGFPTASGGEAATVTVVAAESEPPVASPPVAPHPMLSSELLGMVGMEGRGPRGARGAMGTMDAPQGRALLAVVGAEVDPIVSVWTSTDGTWEDRGIQLVGSVVLGSAAKPLAACFVTGTDNDGADLVVVGDSFAAFLRVADGAVRHSRAGIFTAGVAVPEPLTTAAVVRNTLVTGTASGRLLQWSHGAVLTSEAAHKGVVTAMHSVGDLLCTGGADGMVHLWGATADGGRLRVLASWDVARLGNPTPCDAHVRSVCLSPDCSRSKIAVGTRGGEIYEIVRPAGGGCGESTILDLVHVTPDGAHGVSAVPVGVAVPKQQLPGARLPARGGGGGGGSGGGKATGGSSTPASALRLDGVVQRVVAGHWSHEVYGLAPHPRFPDLYVTTGDDATLRLWSRSRRCQLACLELEAMARSVAWSPDGELLCVGLGGRVGAGGRLGRHERDGTFLVLRARDLALMYEGSDSRAPVTVVAFSPTGEALAVGSRDSMVYVYAVRRAGMGPSGGGGTLRPDAEGAAVMARADTVDVELQCICEGSSSAISAVDWDVSGTVLQANNGSGELMFFNASNGEQIRHASEARDLEWHSWSLPMGYATVGCWPSAALRVELGSVDANRDRTLLVTGDTSGRVRLYRFPAFEKSVVPRTRVAHAGSVRRVKFSADGRHVFSVGGADCAVLQWRVVQGAMPTRLALQSGGVGRAPVKPQSARWHPGVEARPEMLLSGFTHDLAARIQ